MINLIRVTDGTIVYFQDAYGTYAEVEPIALANFLRGLPEAGHDEAMQFEL